MTELLFIRNIILRDFQILAVCCWISESHSIMAETYGRRMQRMEASNIQTKEKISAQNSRGKVLLTKKLDFINKWEGVKLHQVIAKSSFFTEEEKKRKSQEPVRTLPDPVCYFLLKMSLQNSIPHHPTSHTNLIILL